MLAAMAPVALVGLLAGCAAGPDFRPPVAPADAGYTETPLPASTVAADAATGDAQRFVEGATVPAQWWTAFSSRELDRRIAQALAHNPSVESAQAALRQAQENVRAARGSLFPSVDGTLGANRQKSSGASFGVGTPGAGIDGGATIFTVYNASVDVSYTLDLFGGVRRGVEAQSALADFQRYQLEGTYLSLAANVATASFREASLRGQIEATEEIVGVFRKQLDLIGKQHEIGAKSLGDVLIARTQVATAEAGLPPLRLALAQTRNQLAVYLGRFPSGPGIEPIELDALALPREVPVSLPSKLVEQRPDLRAAEAELHRATAEVGVATANLLPQISLSGSYGVQSLATGDLFNGASAVWNLGANLLAPIFHGGTLRAQKRAAEAGLDQAAADYRSTVLTAFRNVADSLRALELDAESLDAQARAEDAAQRSLDLVQSRYRDGAVDYLQVLDSTRQYQQARIALIQARAARLTDTAALYAALGGGWSDVDIAGQAAPLPAAATPSS
ncbi:MAG TPA: efflux transporter outer membrane subunit [Rhodanobacteraceae bacterium]|nr:efflux transporter outer membrane subunit [Rhodanobacteraceae bacterium]